MEGTTLMGAFYFLLTTKKTLLNTKSWIKAYPPPTDSQTGWTGRKENRNRHDSKSFSILEANPTIYDQTRWKASSLAFERQSQGVR